ncbi:MAG: peptidoglycan DD-metalloendopeptidase family protein, partial [Patescibacteria group bacterium]|nr:peptidoglycan DD-metalloendopeptidase family protein [Patescibacteria group bacterium]
FQKYVIFLLIAAIFGSNAWQINNAIASLTTNEIDQALEKNIRFQELSGKLTEKSSSLTDINSIVTSTTSDLKSLRSEKASLADQLNILQYLTEQNESQMHSIESQIANKNNEIKIRETQLETIEKEIVNMKSILKEYARVLYNESEKSTLEMLLESETFAEAITKIRDIELVEGEGEKVFTRIHNLYDQIGREKQQIAADTNKLEMLKKETIRKQNEIALTLAARQTLLKLTENNEKRFQMLLEMAKERQQLLSQTVADLTSRLALERQDIVEKLKEQAEKAKQLGQSTIMLWPLDPSEGITAYFDDPGYKSYFGVNHGAIDIRVPQGTPIQAPEYGYVYSVYQNGFDYAYILLAHADDTFTLYGHVSEVLAKEGDMVSQGQIIGKTGGMPGTIGAGLMTTGPHLHFEVHKNGQKINPLTVLPEIK